MAFIRDDQAELPAALQKAQRSLGPFIKARDETLKIRKILSSHLSSQLNSQGDLTLCRPLSLIDPSSNVENTSHGIRGLQKEYLRCARANLQARNEYTAASREHHAGDTLENTLQEAPKQSNGPLAMECFVHLTMQQQKHERLRITQDYIEVLSQKPAATTEHLDPQVALRDVESLPKVPAEVLHTTSNRAGEQGTDLKELVGQLEKSVLRAKLLLKKEQRLLAKVRSDNNTVSSASQGDRLQALGLTRNALINWIEAEMEKAGDGADAEDQEISSHETRGKDYIEAQLTSIQRQYVRYLHAREALVTSAVAPLEAPTSMSKEEESNMPELPEDLHLTQGMQVVCPYLEKMVSTANEQKAAIQQRSHLTISLAKQLKEASQGLDRLADESHLLPAHPRPTSTSQRKGLERPLSFSDELLHHEKPDSSERARAWVFAAKSSSTATKDSVSEQLETGGGALEEARHSLSGLYQLLGYGDSKGGKSEAAKQDIWTVLDGSLGVIKGDGTEGK